MSILQYCNAVYDVARWPRRAIWGLLLMQLLNPSGAFMTLVIYEYNR